jgi:prevent-host-death family protein
MQRVSVTEAKARWSQILNDVERGETIMITRHGRHSATLKPVGCPVPTPEVRSAAVDVLMRFAEEHQITTGGMSIREMIEAGRR